MALWERARRVVTQIWAELERRYVHNGPEENACEAVVRMALRDVIGPYQELGESAHAFVRGGEFYVPGSPEALRRLDRLRRAVDAYEPATYRNRDDQPGLQEQVGSWAESLFTQATDTSIVEHLRREVKELAEEVQEDEPDVRRIATEMADCYGILLHLAHRNHIDLESEARAKLRINRQRHWGMPDAQGVVEHLCEEGEEKRTR